MFITKSVLFLISSLNFDLIINLIDMHFASSCYKHFDPKLFILFSIIKLMLSFKISSLVQN